MSDGHDHRHHDHQSPHHDHDHGHAHRSHAVRLLATIFGFGHSHDPAERVDSAMRADARGIRALKISLLGLAATAVIQAAVVAFTGSVALLGDTLHNLADSLTAVPLWIAFRMARRLPNRRYTYGYGRAEDLAGIFIVGIMAASSLAAGWESVLRVVHPHHVSHLWAVALAGAVGFLGNEAVAAYRVRIGRSIGSASLVADGLHARTDGLTSLAVLIGAGGVWAGLRVADPVVGLAVTVAILAVLRTAARDVYRRLMDAVDPDLVEQAERVLSATPGVLGVSELQVRWIGHRLLAEASVEVDPSVSVVEAHDVVEAGTHELLHELPRLAQARIHVNPHDHGGAGYHDRTAHHSPGS